MKYTAAVRDRIYSLIATGKWKIEDVCQMANVSTTQFYEWRKNKPEFAQLIEDAQAAALDNYVPMAMSGLAKLLEGETIQEKTEEYRNVKEVITVETSFVDESGKVVTKRETRTEWKPIKVQEKLITKTFRPNPASVFFTLSNRDPDNWKNRQQNDISIEKSFLDLLKESSSEKFPEDNYGTEDTAE